MFRLEVKAANTFNHYTMLHWFSVMNKEEFFQVADIML